MTKYRLPVYSFNDMAIVRCKLGLTQKDMGNYMYLTRRHIGEIENGATRPTGASTILYGVVLEGICKERGTTFEKVLNC